MSVEGMQSEPRTGDPSGGLGLVQATERLYRTLFTGSILVVVATVAWGLVNQPFDNHEVGTHVRSLGVGAVLLCMWSAALAFRLPLFRLLRRQPGWTLAIAAVGAAALWIDGAPRSLYYLGSLSPLLMIAVSTDLGWTIRDATLLGAAYAIGAFAIHDWTPTQLSAAGLLDDVIEQIAGYVAIGLVASLPLESLGGFVLRISQVSARGAEGPSGTRGETASDRPLTARLSVREVEVTQLVAEGLSNDRIAEQLFLSPRTIQTHVANAMRKTETTSRTELAVVAVREGLLPPSPG